MPSAFLQWLYADAADVPQTGYEVSRNSDPMSPKFTRPRDAASGSRCTVNFLEDGERRFPAGPLRPEQEAILAFFTCLKGQVEFCASLARGLRTHFLTTNY